MGDFEWKKRPDDRTPAWRSSEGRMWEASPVAKKEGRDHLTGYEAHEQEGDARPREAARMAGSYGDISVGVSKKKELTLVVSKRRSREGPAATQAEKTLMGASARKINLSRGNFKANAHDPKKSAVAYRESHQKTPYFMLQKYKEMMRGREQDVLEEQVPFLNQETEREELRRLQSVGDHLRAKGGEAAKAELGRIEARKQYLRQSLTEKQSQERRLRLLLQKAQEESRRRAGEAERVNWQPQNVLGADESPPPEGEGQGENPLEALADVLLSAALESYEQPQPVEQSEQEEKES